MNLKIVSIWKSAIKNEHVKKEFSGLIVQERF